MAETKQSKLSKIENIYLPAELFYFSTKKSKNISPAASFNPVAAASGYNNAFQNSTSPSDNPSLKTLIIDSESFSKFWDYGLRIAIIKKLQLLGFSIHIKSTNGLNELKEDFSNITDLQKLEIFNKDQDYETLLSGDVARDKAIVIGQELLKEIDNNLCSGIIPSKNEENPHIVNFFEHFVPDTSDINDSNNEVVSNAMRMKKVYDKAHEKGDSSDNIEDYLQDFLSNEIVVNSVLGSLQNFPTHFVKILLESLVQKRLESIKFSGFIEKCVDVANERKLDKQLILRVFDVYKDLVNSATLVKILKIFPDNAQELIELNQDKITNIDDLAKCIIAAKNGKVSDDVINKLIKNYLKNYLKIFKEESESKKQDFIYKQLSTIAGLYPQDVIKNIYTSFGLPENLNDLQSSAYRLSSIVILQYQAKIFSEDEFNSWVSDKVKKICDLFDNRKTNMAGRSDIVKILFENGHKDSAIQLLKHNLELLKKNKYNSGELVSHIKAKYAIADYRTDEEVKILLDSAIKVRKMEIDEVLELSRIVPKSLAKELLENVQNDLSIKGEQGKVEMVKLYQLSEIVGNAGINKQVVKNILAKNNLPIEGGTIFLILTLFPILEEEVKKVVAQSKEKSKSHDKQLLLFIYAVMSSYVSLDEDYKRVEWINIGKILDDFLDEINPDLLNAKLIEEARKSGEKIFESKNSEVLLWALDRGLININHIKDNVLEDFSIRDQFKKGKVLFVPTISHVAQDQNHTTFLYIANLDNEQSEKLSLMIEGGYFRNITSIKIERFEDISLVYELVKKLNRNQDQIRALSLPGDHHLEKTFENILKLYPNLKVNYFSKNERYRNEIFISTKAGVGLIKNDEEVEYKLAHAGNILNDSTDIPPQIRTGLKYHDISKSLDKEQSIVGNNLTKIELIKFLTPDDIKVYKKALKSEGVYYQFSAQLQKGEYYPLLSVSSKDELIGILSENRNIKIFQDENGFFYVSSDQDCEISYVIKAPYKIKSYQDLPDDHPIRSAVEQYKNDPKFNESASKEQIKMAGKYERYRKQGKQNEYLKMLFDERAGVCWQRVVAMKWHLLTNVGIKSQNIREVSINNNHAVLEVLHENRWYRIDLGGAEGTNIINRNDKYKPASAEIKKPMKLSRWAGRFTTVKKNDEVPDKKVEFVSNERVEDNDKKDPQVVSKNTPPNTKKDNPILKLSTISAEKTNKAEDLLDKINSLKNHKTLIITDQIEEHSVALLEELSKQDKNVFYIDNPTQINLSAGEVLIKNDGIICRKGNSLADFLNKNQDPKNPPIIIVNWECFDAKQKVSLNTLLDPAPSISGTIINQNARIISLCNKISDDESFKSRHDKIIESDVDFDAKSRLANDNNSPVTIDLEGFADWKSALFGRVFLEENEIKWTKSKFVDQLQAGENNFSIGNISSESAKEIEYEFRKARAVGKIFYHGYEITIPENFIIKCSDKSLSFSEFSTKVVSKVTHDKVPQEVHLINTQIFDILLNNKEINGEAYSEISGLIKEKEGDELKLFITSELSENQYYCLFYQAKIHNVELTLYLAPNVSLPKDVKLQEIESNITEEKHNQSNIFVTNNPAEFLSTISENNKYDVVIDVEDLNYQDLVERIEFQKPDYEKGETQFSGFKKVESQLIKKLRNGEKIILKGKFAPDLLQMLEPLILGKLGDFAQNLTLIIEDEVVKSQKKYNPLEFLGDALRIYHFEKSKQSEAEKISEEEPNRKIDENSEQEAQDFIKKRRELLVSKLGSGTIVEMVGQSGVGKSQLIKILEQQNDVEITREISSFASWAEDDRPKTKILFIDESNIDDFHYTIFSPLKDGRTQIFYKGKFYNLDENHKVVFARNPHEFGGGRIAQKLFEDGKIPQIELKDFPASYIYETILKEAIYNKLSDDDKSNISEKEFKNKAQILINQYYQNNQKYRDNPKEFPEFTVRELQEQCLGFVANKLNLEIPTLLESENFVSTNATKSAEESLFECFKIRNLQKANQNLSGSGTNGIIFEGRPGIGKSEMIRAFLENKKVAIINDNDDENYQEDQVKCYKIDASMPFEDKKKVIIKAFEEGNLVWIDELNSCIDDGLEKILNAVLTGQHPTNKDVELKAGFMMIASTNPAFMEGRSIISPALTHRCNFIKMKDLSEYKSEDFETIVNNWSVGDKEINIKKIANDFYKAAQQDQKLNLRSLKKCFDGKDHFVVKKATAKKLDQSEQEVASGL